jgi:hypothetical protein
MALFALQISCLAAYLTKELLCVLARFVVILKKSSLFEMTKYLQRSRTISVNTSHTSALRDTDTEQSHEVNFKACVSFD